MYTKKIFVSILLAVAGLTNAAAVPVLDKRDGGFLKLDFTVSKGTKNITNTSPLEARSNGVESLTLTNERDVYYVADLYFGTNKQKISVDIDTGSSDLWVIDSESGIEGTYGVYDHSQSSAYQDTGLQFDDEYLDKSYAKGEFVTDDVSLSPNGPTIKDLQFGDATSVNQINFGILGVGFQNNEAAYIPYPNFPLALKDAGIIDKVAYSLYLNEFTAETGSILFGGIDNAKYTGDLVTIPFSSSVSFQVEASGITRGGSSLGPFQVVLDSGSTQSSLTPDLFQQLIDLVKPKYSGKLYYWDSIDDVPNDVEITIGDFSLTFSPRELAANLWYSDGTLATEVGLAFGSQPINILGDNFLRSVYAVYDLENSNVQLAKAKYTTDSSISVIS